MFQQEVANRKTRAIQIDLEDMFCVHSQIPNISFFFPPFETDLLCLRNPNLIVSWVCDLV